MTLQNYITEALEKPFVWGEHDCILFAIGWLNIRAGKNWMAGLPEWRSVVQAQRVVKQVGGLEARFDQLFTRITPTTARDGDIALIKRTAFLFSGPHIVAPGPNGLMFIDRMNAKCAWSC